MSYMKRWLEEHIDEISDEKFLEGGYSQEEIDVMREGFSSNREIKNQNLMQREES